MSLMTAFRRQSGSDIRKPRTEYYGVEIFCKRTREWRHVGYMPYPQATKEALAETRKGGRVHIYHDKEYSALLASR